MRISKIKGTSDDPVAFEISSTPAPNDIFLLKKGGKQLASPPFYFRFI